VNQVKKALRSVSKKYECDLCGMEFDYHTEAVEHAASCQAYSIEDDPKVTKVTQ